MDRITALTAALVAIACLGGCEPTPEDSPPREDGYAASAVDYELRGVVASCYGADVVESFEDGRMACTWFCGEQEAGDVGAWRLHFTQDPGGEWSMVLDELLNPNGRTSFCKAV